jgi:hypothetical protein
MIKVQDQIIVNCYYTNDQTEEDDIAINEILNELKFEKAKVAGDMNVEKEDR